MQLSWICSLCTWLLSFKAASAMTKLDGAVGGSVHFQQFVYWMASLEWRFGLFGKDTVVAVRGYDAPYCYPQYEGRCELSGSGELRLHNLTHADQGQYVFIVDGIPPYPSQIVYYWLDVHTTLSTPSIFLQSPPDQLAHGNHVTFYCDAGNQNVTTYTFYRDGKPICSEPHVTCRDALLLLQPITVSDSGDYTCRIQNPISEGTSDTLWLSVWAQTSPVTLTTNTTGWLWAGEDQAYLHCSTQVSNTTFAWRLNGLPLPEKNSYAVTQDTSGLNSMLTINPVSRNDAAAFTCLAYNAMNTETSNALRLNVSWSPDNTNMSCVWFLGSSRHVRFLCMWHGGYPAANVDLIFDGEVMSGWDEVYRDVYLGNEVQQPELICRGDQLGKKSECRANFERPQAAMHNDSELTLVTEGGHTRMRVELTSPSNLFQDFSWFHLNPEPTPIKNGSGRFRIESDKFESSLLISDVMTKDSGAYECRAQNIIGTSSFTFHLEVTPNAQTSPVTLTTNTTGWLWAGEDQAYLHCSTQVSNTTFAWRLNGLPLPEKNSYAVTQDTSGLNSMLTINPVSRNDAAAFTCLAYNAMNTETSNALRLNVSWSPDNTNMSCVWFLGSSRHVRFLCMWHGGYPAANVDLIFDGEVMSGWDEVYRDVYLGNEVQQPELICRGDQLGKKSECRANFERPQAAMHNDSELTLVTEGGHTRMRVELTSPSNLFQDFSWFHLNPEPTPIKNGSGRFRIESDKFESSLLISDVMTKDSGAYECRAQNIIGISSFTFHLEVTPNALPSSGLNSGAIAGIAIGAVAGVVLVGFAVFFVVRMLK